MSAASTSPARQAVLQRAVALEQLTVGWNVLEGFVAVVAARAAGSIALLGFGVDSFVECASGLVLLWRLTAEQGKLDAAAIEELDRRARRLVSISLFVLAGYVAFDAGRALWSGERPAPTAVGIAVTLLSTIAMVWLARAKRSAAASLSSRALQADAFQTSACFWLSIITLAGIAANAAFGWWWADPLAALGMTWFIAREGLETWRGEECACTGGIAMALQEEARPTGSCGCSRGCDLT